MMASRTITEAKHLAGGHEVDFVAVVDQVMALLRQRGRVTYSTLKRQFQLDEAALEDLKNELIKGQRLAVDERGNVLVWTGDAGTGTSAPSAPVERPGRHPSPTPHPISRRRSSPPAVPSKANASRSPYSLPTSRARRN